MSTQQQFGPVSLPSGKSIVFRRPNGGDKLEILQRTPISSDDNVSGQLLVNAYIAAKCLVNVDGQPFNGDYKYAFTTWDNQDSEFYTALFTRMFKISDDMADQIQKQADFLLGISPSGDTSTLPSIQQEA